VFIIQDKRIIKSIDELIANIGKNVIISGKISDIVWQHTIQLSEDYQYYYYFDLDDGNQIIIYTKNKIDENKLKGKQIYVNGTVIQVMGLSKSYKKDERETYIEYHLNVDKILIK